MPDPIDYDRALDYPYDIPNESYRFDGATGDVRFGKITIESCEPGRAAERGFCNVTITWDAQRIELPEVCPVLAAGSNASPAQLALKYRTGGLDPIYCLRARFNNTAPVYSAHLTSYGAVAACLIREPAASGYIFVGFLSDAALDQMHKTESLGVNYRFSRADFARAEPACSSLNDRVLYYESLHGPLISNQETPIALSSFGFDAPRLPHRTEREVLRSVKDMLARDLTLTDFIELVVRDKELRGKFNSQLKSLRVG